MLTVVLKMSLPRSFISQKKDSHAFTHFYLSLKQEDSSKEMSFVSFRLLRRGFVPTSSFILMRECVTLDS